MKIKPLTPRPSSGHAAYVQDHCDMCSSHTSSKRLLFIADGDSTENHNCRESVTVVANPNRYSHEASHCYLRLKSFWGTERLWVRGQDTCCKMVPTNHTRKAASIENLIIRLPEDDQHNDNNNWHVKPDGKKILKWRAMDSLWLPGEE